MSFDDFLEEWRNSKGFIEVHTSGSTGQPKLMRLDKKFVKESARRTINFFHLDSDSRLHSCVAADYIGGKMMAVRSELVNCRFSWENPSNRPLTQIDSSGKITLLAVVPSQMDHIVDNLSELPKIENIIIGGAPIPPLLRKKIARSGLNAYETYGMTETASHIALRKISEEDIPFKTLERIKVSVDKDSCLQIILPDGERFYTNDIGLLLSEKEFFVAGRKDNVINTGGKKINPEILENNLSDYLGYPVMLSSMDDDKWGERLVMLMESQSPEDLMVMEMGKKEILNRLRKILPGWQIPKDLYFVSQLPKTPNGKIKRLKGKALDSFLNHQEL